MAPNPHTEAHALDIAPPPTSEATAPSTCTRLCRCLLWLNTPPPPPPSPCCLHAPPPWPTTVTDPRRHRSSGAYGLSHHHGGYKRICHHASSQSPQEESGSTAEFKRSRRFAATRWGEDPAERGKVSCQPTMNILYFLVEIFLSACSYRFSCIHDGFWPSGIFPPLIVSWC